MFGFCIVTDERRRRRDHSSDGDADDIHFSRLSISRGRQEVLQLVRRILCPAAFSLPMRLLKAWLRLACCVAGGGGCGEALCRGGTYLLARTPCKHCKTNSRCRVAGTGGDARRRGGWLSSACMKRSKPRLHAHTHNNPWGILCLRFARCR